MASPLAEIQKALADLRTRLEQVDELSHRNRRDLEIQFQRIAQMQVELDQIRAAWLKPLPRKTVRLRRP
jgi:hypothetical protein